MRLTKFVLLGMLCFILAALPSSAQIGEKLSLHGFGGWGYGKTDGNKYLIGNHDGSFRNSQFALNITARPYDKLTINTQLYSESGLAKDKVELDYAFFEWAFSDAFKLRIGKVKCPFGIYSEVFDVGTIRPFYELPQAIYGKLGITNKSYYGAGITGNFFLNNNWTLQYDFYGGEMVFQDSINNYVVPIPYEPYLAEVTWEFTSFDEEMIGTRLVVQTPMEGLNFGASYFTGNPQFLFDGENATEDFINPGRFFHWNLHVEYTTDSLWIRSEYVNVGRRHEKDFTMKGGYIETAYKFLNNWQIALQYNRLRIGMSPIYLETETEKHDEFAFGLNYWISSDLVLKCSYHIVDGTYYPIQENLLEKVLSGSGLKEKTNLFIFGTQFSF